MRGFYFFVRLFSLIVLINAASIVYVEDLPAFSALAPCAGSAVEYAVQALTYSDCPPGVTALQSCACTKDQNSAALSATLSSQVLASCGTIASDDVSSASVVLSNYCNQAQTANPFPSPTNGVTEYITQIPAWSDLGPCAGSALEYLVQSLTYQQCPPGAPALVSCACLKDQNSLLVSEGINSQVTESCGTTHSEDVASAQAVFAGYCGLNNGTSVFPTPTQFPGSLTYYITDMQEYSSLAPCAMSAVYNQALYTLTYGDCPPNPGPLASCACAKDGNNGSISSAISSDVSGECGSTASADIASALSVFGFYCSAAMGQVKAQGITNSVVTTPYASGGSAPTVSGFGGIPAPTATRTGKNSGSTTGSTSQSSSGSTESLFTVGHSGVPIAAIVGGCVGAALVIILILLGIWLYRRQHRPPLPPTTNAGYTNHLPPPYGGKAELASTSVTLVSPNKSPIFQKPAVVASPIHSDVSPVIQEKPSEMASPAAPNRSEVPGTTNAAELQPGQVLPGRNHEVHGNSQPGHELEGLGANMNSGPVYEMPGHHGWS